MPSFVCESCNDVVKKSTVKKHRFQCDAAAFSCIDCNRTFVGADVDAHTACISEAEKYQGALFTPKKRANAATLKHATSSPSLVASSIAHAAPLDLLPPIVVDGHCSSNGHSKRAKKDTITTDAAATAADSADIHDNDLDTAIEDLHQDDPNFQSSDFAAILDAMQDFKWKKSISAILKSNHGQMPLDTLSAELIASFHAAFATRLAAVVEAKVRSSKKLKLATAADGRTIVTSSKE